MGVHVTLFANVDVLIHVDASLMASVVSVLCYCICLGFWRLSLILSNGGKFALSLLLYAFFRLVMSSLTCTVAKENGWYGFKEDDPVV